MSNSKRFLSLLLALVMVFLVACGPSNDGGNTNKETGGSTNKETNSENSKDVTYVDSLTVAGTNSLETMDYVITNKNADHAFNANFIDGLIENDTLGNLVPSVAESWKTNEDKTVWTFTLKKGIKWATYDGNEYAEVKAQDFLTGLRHAAEFQSGVSWLGQGVIKGYSEYLKSDFSDAEFEKVGVKALDDYTLEYTLEAPTPFFGDYATYNLLLPINKDFLESKGAGCKLGAPNKEDCTFGSTTPDSILYNGAYVLSRYDQKSSIVLNANELYWDKDNVFLKTITEVYDDGADPYSIKTGFEQGTYPQMSMRPTWEDYESIRKQYEEYLRPSLPTSSTFGITMNFNRQSFEETGYAKDETLRQQTKEAIQNLNFRKALRAAFDRQAYLELSAPTHIATESKRNIYNYPDAGTKSDGTTYFDSVTAHYNKDTGENVNLNDGEEPFFGKENALSFIDKAKEEGIVFPINLDLITIETNDTLVKQANSFKHSVEKNTDGQIIVHVVLAPKDVVYGITYYNEDPSAADYDISTFTGWGPDYSDPKTFAETMSPTVGSLMTSLGLGLVDKDGKVQDLEIKEKLGLMEYEELYQKAQKETTDFDKRYDLFAQADAKIVENVLYIPTQMTTRVELVSKLEPFTAMYSQVGIRSLSYKFLKLRDSLVTADEYKAALEAWNKARSEAASN